MDHAVLHLPDGKTLTIASAGLSDDHGFIKDVLLNGKSLDRSYITHEEVMNGGTLKFVFSNEKEADWSHRPLRLPYSESTPR